jgi:ribosomal-protein-alanine N-acetyltransferase
VSIDESNSGGSSGAPPKGASIGPSVKRFSPEDSRRSLAEAEAARFASFRKVARKPQSPLKSPAENEFAIDPSREPMPYDPGLLDDADLALCEAEIFLLEAEEKHARLRDRKESLEGSVYGDIPISGGPGAKAGDRELWSINLKRSIPVLMPGPGFAKDFGPKIPDKTFPIRFPEKGEPRAFKPPFPPLSLVMRPLAPSDLPQALLLDTLCHRHHWSLDEMLTEITRPVGLCLGIFKQSSMLAMVIGWVIQPEFHVLNLSVHPDHRRKGLGRCLMLTALEIARLSGAPTCELETKRGDEAAEGLYASLGFVEVGIRPAYYPDGSDASLLTRGPADPSKTPEKRSPEKRSPEKRSPEKPSK